MNRELELEHELTIAIQIICSLIKNHKLEDIDTIYNLNSFLNRSKLLIEGEVNVKTKM